MPHNLGGVQWVARARPVPASGHTMCSHDEPCVQGGRKCHYHPRPDIMSVLSVSSVSSTQTKSGEIHFSQAQAVTLGRGNYERILRVGGGGRERAWALTLGYIGTSEGRDIGTSAP